MKATINSTNAIVDMTDPHGRRYICRVWEGVTEAGVAFTAYIGRVQVLSADDNSEFVRDLAYNDPPSEDTKRAIDMRFIV